MWSFSGSLACRAPAKWATLHVQGGPREQGGPGTHSLAGAVRLTLLPRTCRSFALLWWRGVHEQSLGPCCLSSGRTRRAASRWYRSSKWWPPSLSSTAPSAASCTSQPVGCRLWAGGQAPLHRAPILILHLAPSSCHLGENSALLLCALHLSASEFCFLFLKNILGKI